jgi:multiple sugar transport system substrate-binding protein
MTTLDRRALLGLGAGGIALAAGCSSSAAKPTASASATTSGAASAAPVTGTLRLSWYGGAPVHTAMQASMDAFKAANSGVTVTGAGVGFGDYWDKLATETAGGTPPDVFRMSMTYFSDYAARGALADLTADVDKGITTSTLDPDVKASGLVGGKMVGIGQSSICPAMFSNQAMLQKLGMTLPTDQTWDEFATFVKDAAKAAGPDKYGSSDLAGNWQMFDVYARQQVGNQFDDAGKLKVDKATLESWFAYWKVLRDAKAVPPGDVTVQSNTFETNVMSRGLSPITYGWVQQVTFFQPLIKDGTVAVTPLPQKAKGDQSGLFVKALDFWCISAKTKSMPAALAMVNFLVNNDAATKNTGLLLGVPPTKAARNQLASGDAATKAAIAYVEGVTPKAGKAPGPWPKKYNEVMSAFGRASENVAFGKATPAASADAFIAEARGLLG